jgi:hypothetical protein
VDCSTSDMNDFCFKNFAGAIVFLGNKSSVTELLDVSVSCCRKVPHAAHNFICRSVQFMFIVMVICKSLCVVKYVGTNFCVIFCFSFGLVVIFVTHDRNQKRRLIMLLQLTHWKT